MADQQLLEAILRQAVRAEALAVEGLALQAKVHSGLLGGNTDQLVRAAEERAYARAEVLLRQLLQAAAA